MFFWRQKIEHKLCEFDKKLDRILFYCKLREELNRLECKIDSANIDDSIIRDLKTNIDELQTLTSLIMEIKHG